LSSLFLNKVIEENFVRDGFVTMPLLNDLEVAALLDLYQNYYKEPMTGLQPLLRSGSIEQNIAIHQKIGDLVMPALNRHFKAFSFNANHFIAKGANDPNEFRLHQDWNVIDEHKYLAAHVWIALQDINEQNGGLFIIKGSHKFFDNYRSGSCGITFISTTKKVNQYVTKFTLKAGEAIAYQQALFHGSYPNLSNIDRLACLSSIRSANAPMSYFHRISDEYIEEYYISPEFLFRNISQLEKGISPNLFQMQPASLKNFNKPAVIDEYQFEQNI